MASRSRFSTSHWCLTFRWGVGEGGRGRGAISWGSTMVSWGGSTTRTLVLRVPAYVNAQLQLLFAFAVCVENCILRGIRGYGDPGEWLSCQDSAGSQPAKIMPQIYTSCLNTGEPMKRGHCDDPRTSKEIQKGLGFKGQKIILNFRLIFEQFSFFEIVHFCNQKLPQNFLW